MKAADIPTEDVLVAVAHVQTHNTWATTWDLEAILPSWSPKVLRAKLAKMIRRKLLRGCSCGCRGDYEVTELGHIYLARHGDARLAEAAS